jgi:signal transduction histidine kinase
MNLPRPYSLQSKFILRLIGCLILISVINLTALYFFMQKTLEEEVSTRATIVLQQVDAVQKYVQTRLRPKMLGLLPDSFVLEAMSSSYISRSVMENAHPVDSDYVYRRVAINARNPVFEANEVERELIAYFRDNQDKELWQGLKTVDDQSVFVRARPVKFVESCMLCHGKASDAPIEMTQKYGERGFDHDLNQISGVDLVGIPTTRYAVKNMADFTLYVVVYLIITALVLLMIYLTFQRVVLVNFRTLTSQFRKNFHDQKGEELLQKVEHGDEIEEMIEGMEGLSQHLFETDLRLKEYTADLEREVDRRTEQLSRENDTHKKDLTMLVSVLGALKVSRNRPELWRNALPLLADRFFLVRASYVCTFSGNQDFIWPEDAEPPVLPADYVELLLEPKLRFSDNKVIVPVGSSDDNIDGLLLLERPENIPFSTGEAEMLTAVGRQLGIAAENLAALGTLLSQADNLQTIFEGIPDPLLLLDRGGSVIMANNAANRLMEELSCQDRKRGVIDCLLKADNNKDRTELNNVRQLTALATQEVELNNGRSFIVNTIELAREENRSSRIVVSIQEDTDKKKMLRQFVQAEKMGTVGKLAAGLAHEMNNPLGVILCYAELLKKTLTGEQHKTDIDVIIKHTSQAQAVLLDLLNFARPKVSTHRETVIGDVVESVIGVFKVQAAKKGVALTCHRDDAGTAVRVEPQVVEHIILNLLLNALDALPEEAGTIAIDIACDLKKPGLRLTVSDNGSGIDPAVLPSIFDPFFSTKDVNKGSGLGLAVIYGYMRELGGTIEARNRQTGGAVFELYFPITGGV